MNLNSAVDGFVGANLFARSTSYVRINSHLQKQHNSLKYQNVLRQQRNTGLTVFKNFQLPKPDKPEPNVGRALPDMVGGAHPTDATLTCFSFTWKAAPGLDLRYILVTNCNVLTDKRLNKSYPGYPVLLPFRYSAPSLQQSRNYRSPIDSEIVLVIGLVR